MGGGFTPVVSAQNLPRCGNTAFFQQIAQYDPAFAAQREQGLAQDQQRILQMGENTAQKGTAQNPIPVVFHVLLSALEYQQLGRDTGVIRRVNSQLAVLNADYTATNTDLYKVPAPFQSRIGASGLQFRRASGTSAQTIAPGIEVKITNKIFDYNSAFADAKRTSQGGLDGWDPSRQLNIWVLSTSGTILGLAIPPSAVGATFPGGTITTADLGVVVSHSAFGRRDFPAQYFFPGTNDQGRTLTHEIGHYFELEHVFGNDPSCTSDDGIADTPPQSEPTYSQPGAPVFPKYDACSPAGNGIMFMNYMDYVDDAEMMLFTKQQVARMQFYTSPGQASYSLTQQPLSVAQLEPANELVAVAPNPSSGIFLLQNKSTEALTDVAVLDMSGRTVSRLADLSAQESQSVNLSGLSRGFYFLKMKRAHQTFTLKVVLQ